VKIFLSHVNEESHVALAIKAAVERALPGVHVFVSAVDIRLGDRWQAVLEDAVTGAIGIIVLCSPASLSKPWINFESGAGWGREIPVVAVCHSGLRKEELPYPLQTFQGINLRGGRECRELVERIARLAGVPVAEGLDFEAMADAMTPSPPARGGEIGIVMTHGQEGWDYGAPSVFRIPGVLPEPLRNRWQITPLDEVDQLMTPDLHRFSGLIVAMPRSGDGFRNAMAPEVVDALEAWVRAGGRLLLLGYELGDRHHGGNLGDLSRRFGIHPRADIVGPPGFAGERKPYGVPVDFTPAGEHPLTDGLAAVRLRNVQTLYVEPGGFAWLPLGENVVIHPGRESARYPNGLLRQYAGERWEAMESVGGLAVAVEAPAELCGAGAVHTIGTWQIWSPGPPPLGGDNEKLLTRLLDWLSRQGG
jgi:hypothetical protein